MFFNVAFKINENPCFFESIYENMMFAQLIYNFSQKVGLKEEHKTYFTFNY